MWILCGLRSFRLCRIQGLPGGWQILLFFPLLVQQELITSELVEKMRSWKHSGFSVYVGPSLCSSQDALRVGEYILRAPAASSRLILAEGGVLKYIAKGSYNQEHRLHDACLFEPQGEIFDYLQWIARLTSHIPDPGSQTIRYYGAYSSAHRGKMKKRISTAPSHPDAPAKVRRKEWAALIQLIYEADPLLCPKCRQKMQIVSFIRDGKTIDKILDHLNYQLQVLPLPLAPRPPPPPFFSPDFDSDHF